ncbi:OLC1v1016361C1 [Oldenlandia corymbosa var. corymbosa]|uniref:OLC1v1016361C1 n=1 Tax=Oldenlandia corymbosa var. corymbosa TaxID=529605 RepID=A0AAV1E6S6_OLDCO|nr:OLC1v1016361C1 [Oldenlandia corymbosa var. corymbosa]
MDEFGVLVESTGFKSQKLTPMARLKPKPASNFSFSNGFNQSSPPPSNSNVWNESFVEDLDGIFKPNNNISNSQKSQQYYDDGVDIFGGSSKTQPSGSQGNIDLDSVFGFNNDSRTNSGSKFYNETSPPTGSVGGDDLLGGFDFGNRATKKDEQNNVSNSDDLIPGFGGSNTSPNVSKNNGIQPGTGAFNSTFSMADDPFSLFGNSNTSGNDLSKTFPGPSEKDTGRAPVDFSMDELENLAMRKGSGGTTDKPRVITEVKKNSGPKKQMSDIDLLSFVDYPPYFPDTEESDERRTARVKNQINIKQKMEDALIEKKKRDAQVQKEQEERRMFAETVDYRIKRWSAGKEGNLLALLSSLQDVLWPECGWKPVSLTDLIAPAAVRKVYKLANLYVHPDKVQQKGFNLEQKYIAEKVFDLLKEAYNKHNTQGPQSSFNMPF